MIDPSWDGRGPATIYGMKIEVVQDRPKMQLSERVKGVLTPEQIADHNAWMLQFFGTTNNLKDNEYLMLESMGVAMMNPRGYARLLSAVRR